MQKCYFYYVILPISFSKATNLEKSGEKCDCGKFPLFYSKGNILFTKRAFMLLIQFCFSTSNAPSKMDLGLNGWDKLEKEERFLAINAISFQNSMFFTDLVAL